MRQRLSLATGLVAFLAMAPGCTDGTTPNCADAQCPVVSVVEGGVDSAPSEGGEPGEAAAGDAGDDGTQVPVRDAGAVSDGGADANPAASDGAGAPGDAGDSG
jgi:hypothetical protein